MKTSRISRVIQILTTLQSGQPYTANELAEMLNISRRMIFRDLNELKQVGLPYYFDNKSHCYRIKPGFLLSTPNLNAQEALGLLLLAYKARNHIHLPFKDSTLSAAIKIESDLPEKTKQFCNVALQKISIKADPQERLDLLDQKFTQMLDAILKKRIVAIHYYSPIEREYIETNLSPYHLMYNNHTWYALGKIDTGKEIRVFSLNYIKKLNVLDKCFIEDEKFNLHEHLGRAWSMIPEGRLYNVRLRFLPEVAHGVANIQWHSTQTTVPQNDGSVIIEFRVDGLNEITWWVLSYGDKVQILAPARLREKVVQIAQNMIKQNEPHLPNKAKDDVEALQL
jgi:predicted DNA-binding transcriptional regulator YafY